MTTTKTFEDVLDAIENNNLNITVPKIGDKFSFITSNGDLYEAKLTFIKNMNTKKGGK